MAGQVTLGDLLHAHEGINDTIRKFYPHLYPQEEEEEEEAEEGMQATTTTTTTRDLPQVGCGVDSFLNSVSTLEDAREQLTVTLEKANTAMLTQASATLTHPQVLGQHVAWCVEVEQHMRTIIENKDLLIYHLQQPLVSTFLTMHHRYHKSLVAQVGMMSGLLNRLHCYTDLLERHARHSALDTVDSLISSLTRMAATQRSVHGDITALHALVSSVLHEEE